jgi:hypothetical protein
VSSFDKIYFDFKIKNGHRLNILLKLKLKKKAEVQKPFMYISEFVLKANSSKRGSQNKIINELGLITNGVI